jgi:hypothetical protein
MKDNNVCSVTNEYFLHNLKLYACEDSNQNVQSFNTLENYAKINVPPKNF